MPQVDPEALVSSVCDDRKIASVDERQSSSDDPPQSFWLSQEAEFDWFDRNAVLQRTDSTKGNCNSNSNTTPSHLSNSTSQRLPVKKSILALPKPKRSDVKQRRIRTVITLFPRRSTSTAPTAEPSSPKVSCMGRVRSKRDKSKTASAPATTIEPEKTRQMKKKKKNGFWKTLGSICRSSNKHQMQPKDAPPAFPDAASVRNDGPASEPASLLLTKGFVSGRRSDSWIGTLDSESELPAKDSSVKSGAVVVRQRSVGPLSELNCGTDFSSAGPVKAAIVTA